MASRDLQRLVAAQVALGAPTAELADRFNYSRRGMRKVVASPAVQALVAQERATQADLLEIYRAQLLAMTEYAIENVRRVIEDPRHPKCVETSRWLLDRVVFPRPEAPQVALNIPMLTAEQAELLSAQIADLQAKRAGAKEYSLEQDPHFHRPPEPW